HPDPWRCPFARRRVLVLQGHGTGYDRRSGARRFPRVPRHRQARDTLAMSTWQTFVRFFTSLRLTVVLLALSIVLVFWATLAQTELGIWEVQERFFRSFFVLIE